MPPHWNKISTRHLVCDLGKLHLHRASLLLGLEHLPGAEIAFKSKSKPIIQSPVYLLQGLIENCKKKGDQKIILQHLPDAKITFKTKS